MRSATTLGVLHSFYELNNFDGDVEGLIQMNTYDNVGIIVDGDKVILSVEQIPETHDEANLIMEFTYPRFVMKCLKYFLVFMLILFVVFNMQDYYDIFFRLVHEQELSGNNDVEQ